MDASGVFVDGGRLLGNEFVDRKRIHDSLRQGGE